MIDLFCEGVALRWAMNWAGWEYYDMIFCIVMLMISCVFNQVASFLCWMVKTLQLFVGEPLKVGAE